MSLYDGTRAGVHPSTRPSVRLLTISNMNISETSRSIIIKIHLEHHWGEGKTALGFWPDPIRTLGVMATYSSNGVTMGKYCEYSSSSIFDSIFFILAGNE